MLVSVIIPIFNIEPYLERCIISLLKQSYKNLEIICVNDNSKDDCLNILKKYAKKDRRIKIINRSNNGGLSAARNTGLDFAKGKYTYFIDGDDWIETDYIKKMVQKAKYTNADIIQNTNIVTVTEKEEKPYDNFQYIENKGKYLNNFDAVNKTHCMVWCHFYKTSFLKENNLKFPENYVYEDEYFQHISKYIAKKFFMFYGAKYYYFKRKDSITNERKNKFLPYLKIAKLIRDYYLNSKGGFDNTKIFCSRIFEPENEDDFELLKEYFNSIKNYIKEKLFLFNDFEKWNIKAIFKSKTFFEYKKTLGKNKYITYNLRLRLERKKNIKASVIIPVLNEYKLEKCLDSVLAQSFSDIEIICINNPLKDTYLNILKKYAINDNRIKITDNNIVNCKKAALSKNIFVIEPDKKIDFNYIENKILPKIPVFISSDNNFAPFLAINIASILDNTKSYIDFYILDGGISLENQEKIKKLKEIFSNFSIEFIKINQNKYFKNFIETKTISKAMYFRFLIPYLKPEIDKALYSDADVIFLDDIKKMFDEPLYDYAIGAVWEGWTPKENNYSNFSKKPFYSGNLLLNTKMLREKNIFQKLLKVEKENRKLLKNPDQDILNIYFKENYKMLDKKYCYTTQFALLEKINFKPVVRHFNGIIKPWQINPQNKNSSIKNLDDFWYYAAKTNFYEELYKKTLDEDSQKKILRQLKIYYSLIKKDIEGLYGENFCNNTGF